MRTLPAPHCGHEGILSPVRSLLSRCPLPRRSRLSVHARTHTSSRSFFSKSSSTVTKMYFQEGTKLKGGGTLYFQKQLLQDHPGRQLVKSDGKSWWLVQRHDPNEPSRWSNESSGVILHKDKVIEAYHVSIEENGAEADHVKTNDESTKPEHLKRGDKQELKQALRSSLMSPGKKTSWLAVMLASMLTAKHGKQRLRVK